MIEIITDFNNLEKSPLGLLYQTASYYNLSYGFCFGLVNQIYNKFVSVRKVLLRHETYNFDPCKKLEIRICIMQSDDLIFMAILIFYYLIFKHKL